MVIYLALYSSQGRVTSHCLPICTICAQIAGLPLGSCGLPGDRSGALSLPIWPCSRRGLAAAMSPRQPDALTIRFHPYHPLNAFREGGIVSVPLSVRIRFSETAWVLPSTVPDGARTFLSSGCLP